MATPNMPSSAQDIINNFLSGGYSSQAQANPYRVDVDPFRPPTDTPDEDDKSPTDPCPEGYIYDPVIKSCVPPAPTRFIVNEIRLISPLPVGKDGVAPDGNKK